MLHRCQTRWRGLAGGTTQNGRKSGVRAQFVSVGGCAYLVPNLSEPREQRDERKQTGDSGGIAVGRHPLTGSAMVWAGSPAGQQTATPDNTKTNQRDRNDNAVTADQKKENRTDRELARQIRRAIVKDKSLSTASRAPFITFAPSA